MNKLFKILLSLGLTLLAPTILMAGESHDYEFESELRKTQNSFTGVIIEYDVTASADDDVHFEMRFKDGKKMTEWVHASVEFEPNKFNRVDTIVNTNLTNEYQYKIETTAGPDGVKPKIENVKFTFINPKGEEEGIIASISSFASLVAARSSGPRIISRSEWGAKDEYNYAEKKYVDLQSEEKSLIKEDDPEIQRIIDRDNGEDLKWPMEYIKDMRMLVIHHTASTSELDNPKQAIRNIQYYHAVKRGWGDIGYNFIIDQDGNIYEGRKGGAKVVGGHALPVNKTSVGIAVLGNFESQKVPKGVLEGIVEIASYQAELYNLDVTKNVTYKEKTYPVLGGHRDNSKTACPGKNLYELMPMIRNLVASGTQIDSNEDDLSGLDYAYIDDNSLRSATVLRSSEKTTIKIKLKNVGKKSWRRSNTYLKSLNSSEYNGSILTDGTKLAELEESSVSPGRYGTFNLEVAAGKTGGNFTIMAQGVLDGETKNSLPIFIPVSVSQSSYGFEIIGNTNFDLKLEKNETRNMSLMIKNTGDLSWNENYKFVKFGVISPLDSRSKLFNNANRIADFGTDEIKPGQSVRLDLQIKAPNEDVTINESYAPVIDGLSWFNEGSPLVIKATVGKGSIVPSNKPADVTLQSNGNVLGPDIRINISNFTKSSAEISSAKEADLIVDSKVVAELDRNERLTIEKSSNEIVVTAGGKSFTGSTIRIESNDSENIITIHDYENRPSWNLALNDNEFRGDAELRIIDNGLRFINELPIEYYMRGVAEISNNAGSEKIKTIMVAARTYAYFHATDAKDRKFPGKGYNLDDSPERTQKYLGYGFEKRSPNVVKALKETAGKIITYNDKVVVIPYFNNSDGRTRSAQEVWGWNDAPYLVSVSDSYCANPNQLLGHGVGISGCGSSGMAEAGFNHEEILKYFLKGVEFKIAYSDTTGNVSANSFKDVNSNTEFAKAIEFVRSRGIVEGYADGTYKPTNSINRAEFTKILIEAKYDSIPAATSCFSDVKSGEWYAKYVCLAKSEGIIEGYPDKTFKPAQVINLAEALKIVLETFYTNIPNQNGEWYTKYVTFAKNDGLYISRWQNVSANLSRGEMAELIYRVLN
jgi:hypothetical protein